MVRVWFNHWFSTAYHLINLLKEGDAGKFTVIGTSKNALAIYLRACDERYLEKEGPENEAYVDFCLDFCREHAIDVFVPRRGLNTIARYRDRFAAQGVKVLCGDNADTMEVLDEKAKTYAFFRENGIGCIPPHRVAHSFEEFLQAGEELAPVSKRICYKLTRDEGAMTFRVIDDNLEAKAALFKLPGQKVSRQVAESILRQYDYHIPLLVMPFLDGQEVSADCLRTAHGDIVIPRYKTNQRYSVVRFNEEIVAHCKEIMQLLDIRVPMNIQFKLQDGKPWLLEINPRMSGGLQLSCLAAGVNIPNIAVNQLLGVDKEWQLTERREQRVANIETPIILD